MASKDWLIRQIELMSRAIGGVVMQKDSEIEIFEETGTLNELWVLNERIKGLLAKKEICKAEDLLFSFLEEHPASNVIPVAKEFYSALAEMSDEELQAHNFSRPEIEDGISRIVHHYNKDNKNK